MKRTEHRSDPRTPIELRVAYAKVDAFFADYTRNLSKGGTFIRTPHPLPVGTTFVFRLTIPGVSQTFALQGEVTWTVHAGEAETPVDVGMGIRFVFRDEAQRGEFERAVEELRAGEQGENASQPGDDLRS